MYVCMCVCVCVSVCMCVCMSVRCLAADVTAGDMEGSLCSLAMPSDAATGDMGVDLRGMSSMYCC